MGTIVSSILYSEDPSQENIKKISYYKIFDTLNKISNTLDGTEEMIKEIEESLKNPQIDVMEWDYYDSPILETKKISAFDF
jgi:hypothetical protein|tara:strand:+ start:71 stop:313 length:243 start_codon:yes stop_codon:yes gene_type:complete